MKKICVITGSRSEYGLLHNVMVGIRQSPDMELQVIATGMHLSPEFGMTANEIEADGFTINHKIEMILSSDTAVGISKSVGLGMIGFSDAFDTLKPHLILILGDRYEIFAAASSAMIAGIPIAHLHGGETTVGAFDEAIRHCITKMSHIHFVASEKYRQRVIQLGEQPKNIFNVGGLGVDSLIRMKLLSRNELENTLNLKLAKRNLLITFHPVTLDQGSSAEQVLGLLAALSELKDTGLIFTMPNADTDSRILFRKIEEFCALHKHASAFISLGQLRYMSCIQHVDGVVGNSSSGLLEAPSFKKGTINIGDRQKGRLKALSVIDCGYDKESIGKALDQLFSKKFQSKIKAVKNPYGDGGASDKILNILRNCNFGDVIKKQFYDLDV